MIAGVDDHRVPGAENRPQRAKVGLVAGSEDQRGLGPKPVGELPFELQVQAVVPFRNRDPVSPVP